MQPLRINTEDLLASLQSTELPSYGSNEAMYKGRLNVIEQIYHQQAESEPTNIEEKYGIILESEEEPYKKKLTIGEEWTLIDTGGFADASLVILRNMEGRYSIVHPTQAQIELVKERVLDVGFGVPTAHIHIVPTTSARFNPCVLGKIHLRCRKGTCKVQLVIVPK